MDTIFTCIIGFSGLANSNMLSEFFRDQRVLPWQPDLGKNMAKLNRFHVCEDMDAICLYDRVVGVGKFK